MGNQFVVTGNMAAMSSAICLCIICHVCGGKSSIPFIYPPSPGLCCPFSPPFPLHTDIRGHTHGRSCSQAWQGFRQSSAEFKVVLWPLGDTRGCFLPCARFSFVCSRCLRSVVGYFCIVAHELMNRR